MHPAETHILKVALSKRDDLPQDNWQFVTSMLNSDNSASWIYKNVGSGQTLYLNCKTSMGEFPWEYTTRFETHD